MEENEALIRRFSDEVLKGSDPFRLIDGKSSIGLNWTHCTWDDTLRKLCLENSLALA